MTPNTTLDRRDFLKKSAAIGIAGLTGATAATGTASADTNPIRVVGNTGAGVRYVMRNTTGSFYENGDIESEDYAGDRAVGTLYGGQDNYTCDGLISYVNFADGNTVDDPQIHFDFQPNDNGDAVVINAEEGQNWYYELLFGGLSSASKGPEAEGNDSVVTANDYISGNVNGGMVDSFNFQGDLEWINVESKGSNVDASIGLGY